MKLTLDHLLALGVREPDAARHVVALGEALDAIAETPLRAGHVLAQVLYETARLSRMEEDLRLSASRLLAAFPKRVTPALAENLQLQPERIANHVYADINGNGDEASGDGWKFRGRGMLQLRGRANYAAFSKWCGLDVVANPDELGRGLAAVSAVYLWTAQRCNEPADADDIREVTRRVSGGLNGLKEREALLRKTKKVLGI